MIIILCFFRPSVTKCIVLNTILTFSTLKTLCLTSWILCDGTNLIHWNYLTSSIVELFLKKVAMTLAEKSSILTVTNLGQDEISNST